MRIPSPFIKALVAETFGHLPLRRSSLLSAIRKSSILLLAFALLATPTFAHARKHGKKHATVTHARRHHSRHPKVKTIGAWKHHGQQGIDDSRALEIQQALVREHYLSGAPTGAWDVSSKAAMQKYQADHGWQTKRIPDARAIISLGLGPMHQANPATELATGQDTLPAMPANSFVAPQK